MTLTCDYVPQLIPTTLRPAVGYVRLSAEAGERNRSLQGMQEDLHKAAKQHGYHLEKILVDDGYSGAIRNRPEFLEWLAEGRQGKALLTWHTDRLTREGINVAGLILDVVEGKDSITGKVTSQPVRYLDCFGTDSENETVFRFKFALDAEVARQERTRIQARNLATQRRLREAGVYRGGRVPYGYRVVPHPSGKGKGLEVEPDEAAHIRLAADHILGGGTLYGALKLWQAMGIKPKGADHWSLSSVRTILIGNSVLGRQCHKGVPVRDDEGNPMVLWEPILTIEEVEQIRAALASKKRGQEPRRKRASRLLSGLLTCSTCGGPLGVQAVGTTYKYVKYNCKGSYQGTGCTRPVNISAPTLEDHIEKAYLARFGRLQAFKTIVALREATEAGHVEAQMQETSRAMMEPGANIPELATRMGELQARRAQLDEVPTAIEQTVDLGCTLAEEWQAADVDTRRTRLKWALDGQPVVIRPSAVRGRHIFDPDRAEIPWRQDMESWAALRAWAANR